jgi:hypothetical protein
VVDFVVFHHLVDRILQQQKARSQVTETTECEEAEKVRPETSASFTSNLPEMTLYDTQAKIPFMETNIPFPFPPASTVITVPESTGVEQTPKRSRLTSAIHELGRHLQRNRSDTSSSKLSFSPSDPDGAVMLAMPTSSRKSVKSQTVPPVTSLSNIGTSSETDIA